MAKRRSDERRKIEDMLRFGTIVAIEPLGRPAPRQGSKNLSTEAQECFEELRTAPGDRQLTDRLVKILRRLPPGNPWLRLDRLVSIYNLGFAPRHEEYLDRYRKLESLKAALRFDNLYMYKDKNDGKEKMYSHQRRLGADILKRASDELSKQANLKQISQCRSFDELLQCVRSATKRIHPFGTLAVYDTALRIGANLGKWPEAVYLHAGAMAGYRVLTGGRRVEGRKSVSMGDLPKEVRVLKPHDAENFLCIFKGLFGNSGSRRSGRSCC